MPKNIEDIIVPEKKRSIRDIPIPENRRNGEGRPNPFLVRESSLPHMDIKNSFDIHREESKFSKIIKNGKWFGIGAGLVVVVLIILSFFDGATLSYVPKSVALSFNNDIYTAEKDGGGLIYSIVKLSKEKGVEVPVTGEEIMRRKASGTIIVYNDAGASSQRLLENTRFQTPQGLIYRIKDAIVVPGRKTQNGITQPGSIEVVVYADEAGDKYNVGLTDFTLPGLKGSALFSKVYARSKTEMSGGFVGKELVVSEVDRTRVKTELEMSLKDDLILEVQSQVPEGFVLYPSLSYTTFEDLPQTDAANSDMVMINKRGNWYGVMFKKTDLSNMLALRKITVASGETIEIVPLDELNLSLLETAGSDLLTRDKISFTVTGSARAVWFTDEVALKTDLAGKSKKELSAVLKNYPTITSANATIRPFWKTTFPKDGGNIMFKKLPVD